MWRQHGFGLQTLRLDVVIYIGLRDKVIDGRHAVVISNECRHLRGRPAHAVGRRQARSVRHQEMAQLGVPA